MKPNINHKCPTCGLGSNIDRICTNCFYIYNPYKHGNCLRCMRTARMRTTKPLNDRMVDFIRTTIPKAEDNKSLQPNHIICSYCRGGPITVDNSTKPLMWRCEQCHRSDYL